MPGQRYFGRSRSTIILLLLTSITLITLDFRGTGFIDTARRKTADFLSPVTSSVSKVFRPVGNVWNGVTEYGSIRDENAKLKAQVKELEAAGLDESGLAHENAALRQLLLLRTYAQYPVVAAEVTARQPSNFDQTVELNIGTDQGVAPGYPVVTGDRLLVGRVVSVSEDRSIVRLITDPTVSVGVEIKDAPEIGVASGTGTGEMTVSGIAKGSGVAVGQLATTTDGLYPEGLVVGTVSEARADSSSLGMRVKLRPAADLTRLQLLAVLLTHR